MLYIYRLKFQEEQKLEYSLLIRFFIRFSIILHFELDIILQIENEKLKKKNNLI